MADTLSGTRARCPSGRHMSPRRARDLTAPVLASLPGGRPRCTPPRRSPHLRIGLGRTPPGHRQGVWSPLTHHPTCGPCGPGSVCGWGAGQMPHVGASESGGGGWAQRDDPAQARVLQGARGPGGAWPLPACLPPASGPSTWAAELRADLASAPDPARLGFLLRTRSAHGRDHVAASTGKP